MTDFGAVLVSGFRTQIQNELTNVSFFISSPVRGDGLIHRASGFHTLQVETINLDGNIRIEGTLSRDANTGPWFPVTLQSTANSESWTDLVYTYNKPIPGVQPENKLIQTNEFYNIIGQFSWLRANISNVSYGFVPMIKLAF